MERFNNVTLRDIDHLLPILKEILSNDGVSNVDLVNSKEQEFREIDDFITTFLSSINSDQYYRFADDFRTAKLSGFFPYRVFANHTLLLLDLLQQYRGEYIANAKERLFSLRVADMTGKDLNEYLQLIGLLK